MMKTHTLPALALVASLLVLPSAALAAFNGPVSNQGVNNMTVSKALGLKFDRENVCLTGRIVSKLATDDDKYMFQDETGSMVVEIDFEDFRGQHVTPNNKVRLCGEVDTEAFRPNEFETDVLHVLN